MLAFRIYPLIFWIPPLVSGILLLVLWEELGRRLLPLAWFAAALLLQAAGGTYSPLWVGGLLLQTVLAIYLGIRWKARL